jgi:hypothetical protein
MFIAGIVEGRPALGTECHVAANTMDDAHDVVALLCGRVAPAVNGHEVDYFPDTFLRQKTGNQNISFRQVHLAALCLIVGSRNFEKAAF